MSSSFYCSFEYIKRTFYCTSGIGGGSSILAALPKWYKGLEKVVLLCAGGGGPLPVDLWRLPGPVQTAPCKSGSGGSGYGFGGSGGAGGSGGVGGSGGSGGSGGYDCRRCAGAAAYGGGGSRVRMRVEPSGVAVEGSGLVTWLLMCCALLLLSAAIVAGGFCAVARRRRLRTRRRLLCADAAEERQEMIEMSPPDSRDTSPSSSYNSDTYNPFITPVKGTQ